MTISNYTQPTFSGTTTSGRTYSFTAPGWIALPFLKAWALMVVIGALSLNNGWTFFPSYWLTFWVLFAVRIVGSCFGNSPQVSEED